METWEKIDLHIHPNKSDGKLSPKEVIDETVKNKVLTIKCQTFKRKNWLYFKQRL